MKNFNLQKVEQNIWFKKLGTVVGSAIVALGLAAFLVPHRIVAGGTSGLATILYHVTGLPIGLLAIAIDIPLFLWAFKIFGFKFLAKTFFVALIMAGFLQLFNILIPTAVSPDPLLSALYGGLATGAGMGLIFRFGATSGGTDLIAAILRRSFGWKLATGLFVADSIIIALSGLIFEMNLILYGIVAVFICTRVVDLIQGGTGAAKAVFIISEEADAVKAAIYEKVERGVTLFYGEGGYLGKSGKIVYSVVSPTEIGVMKDTVYAVDENAFVVVTSATEVLGEGFHLNKDKL